MKDLRSASPILAGLALVLVGELMRRFSPSAFDMPKPRRRTSGKPSGKLPAAAEKARESASRIVPDNLTNAIGRSLLLAGAGLIAMRALDSLVDDDNALF